MNWSERTNPDEPAEDTQTLHQLLDANQEHKTARPQATRDNQDIQEQDPKPLGQVAVSAKRQFCVKHRRTPARWQCEQCRWYWCEECANTRAHVATVTSHCRCGGRLVPFHVSSPQTIRESWRRDLWSSFAYPLSGDGKYQLLLIGGVVAVPLALGRLLPGPLGSLIGIVGYLVVALSVLFFGSFLIHILTKTYQKPEDKLDWPEVSGMGTLVGNWLLIAIPVLLTFSPALVAWALDRTGLALLFAVFGGLTSPFAIMNVVIVGDLVSLSPHRIGKMWAAAPGAMFWVLLLFSATSMVAFHVPGLMTKIPWLGPWLVTSVLYYCAAVSMRMLGHLARYYCLDFEY